MTYLTRINQLDLAFVVDTTGSMSSLIAAAQAHMIAMIAGRAHAAMVMHTTHNLINRLAHEEAALRGQAFLAPLLGDGRVRVRVRGLIYELGVARAQPSWWLCQALDAARAAVVDAAQPWQRGAYLALWPALRLVLMEPLRDEDWVALAFNASDAFQRFAIHGPLVIRLVEGGQPFERVIGRVEGATVWYDELDRRGDPATAERLREALAAGHATPTLAGLSPGERASYALLAERSVAARAARDAAHAERQLRDALMVGGARLIGYESSAGVLRVIWECDGQRSVTLVNGNLDVVSAGICLSGADQHFDLASIIGVVRDAPPFARYHDE